MPDRLRFGIATDQNLPWSELLERWQLFDALGFDSVWNCDHLVQPSRPNGPYFEAWTLLAALAVRTERIRIGVLVSCNTFRHPALLAKEALTVDHLSNGRLDVGLGAGWYEPEHTLFGLEYPSTPERVGRFREAVEVVDGLLRNDTTTYAGRYSAASRLPASTTSKLPITSAFSPTFWWNRGVLRRRNSSREPSRAVCSRSHGMTRRPSSSMPAAKPATLASLRARLAAAP